MKSVKLFMTVALLSALLAGCGGGGGGSTAANPSATTLSGTVAAGAPLSGFVAIKDANGNITTTAIDANGRYTLDTASLTPPLVLYASGVAGGHAYSIASVATVDDVNGTVNITPLTDLVLANVAGTDSTTFFNNPSFGKLNRQAIVDAATTLKARLQPLLSAANIDPDGQFDLMHTAFNADHSGFDGVLDLLDVRVDATTHTATITYAPNSSTSITDDLTSSTDNGVLDTSGTDISGDTSATQAISQRLESFDALFANGTPTAAAIDSYFDNGFMLDGSDKSSAIAFFTSSDPASQYDAAMLREAMRRFSIVSLDTAASPQTASIRFGNQTMDLSNDGSGWRFLGNGNLWGAEATTETHRYLSNNSVSSELNFYITDDGGQLQSGDYFIVTGPGLPSAGVVMVQYDFNSFSNAQSTANLNYGYTVNDAITRTIADGSDYTFTRYRDNNGDTNVYASSPTPVTVADAATLTGTADDTRVDASVHRLAKRPLLSTETARFAAVIQPTANDLSNFSSGSLPVSWTLPDGSHTIDVTFDRSLQDGTYERAADNVVAGTDLATTLDVPVPASTVTQQSVIVFTTDVFGRTVATQQDVVPGQSYPSGGSGSTASILGAWRHVNGNAFQYLVVFSDNTYLYAENDPNAQYASENGVEVGTYSYDAATGALTLNVAYDDNTAPSDGPGSFSGSGSIGYPTHTTASLNSDGSVLTLAGGALVLDAVNFGSPGSEVGVWRMIGATGPGSFSYLVFFPDNTFLYAENDLLATNPADNGLEVGSYSYDNSTGLVTFNLSYDDNAPGQGSGVGDIGTPAVIDGALSNNNDTLTVAGGSLVFNRAY